MVHLLLLTIVSSVSDFTTTESDFVSHSGASSVVRVSLFVLLQCQSLFTVLRLPINLVVTEWSAATSPC